MKKLPLKNIFNSFFHDKFQINDFKSLNIYKHLKINQFKTTIFYSASTIELKKYHIFLNQIIIQYMQVNENVVFSYREGTNILEAVKPHSNNKYFFKTDIKNFFNSISKDLIEQYIKKNYPNFPIIDEDLDNYFESILNIITVENHLPVGFSTSAQLSNAILFDFDTDMESFCIEKNITYTRFSDDLIFSSSEKETLGNLELIIQKKLNAHYSDNFTINSKKTKFFKPGDRVELLGLIITPNGHVTINKTIKQSIEILIHFYLSDKEKFNDYLSKKFKSDLGKFLGLLNFINSVDPSFLKKLRRKYGNYVIDSLMHKGKN